MNKHFRSAVSIVLILGWALPTPADNNLPRDARLDATISVRLFNYAKVPSGELANAQREARRIFHQAGIETDWIQCAVPGNNATPDPRCTAQTRPTDIVMRVVPKEMVSSQQFGEFGVAFIPVGEGFGRYASVYYARVVEYAERWRASEGLLLGHLIAHEIGHLLLEANSHSPSGVMSVLWNREQVERASRATLLFTFREAESMQERVACRMAME